MKTKIFVSSSTSIAQATHSYSITIIPDIITIDGEIYEDTKQMSPESFCNRIKYDDSSLIKISHQNFEYIDNLYKQTKAQGYTDYLFILSPYEYDMEDDLNKLKEQYSDDNIVIYKSNVASFLLALMVIEADKSLKNQVPMKKVIEMLDNMSLESIGGIRIFKETETELISPFDSSILNTKSAGESYIWSNHQFVMIGKSSKKRDKDANPFKAFIRSFFEKTEGLNIQPVLLYSTKNTAYLNYLRDMIKSIYPKLKSIKEIALAPRIQLEIKNGLGIAYLSKM